MVDELAVEEPLEIRVNNEPVAVTMRTPGDDFDLAAGYLVTNGVLKSPDQVAAIRYAQQSDHPDQRNTVNVQLAGGVKADVNRLKKLLGATSPHGMCAKTAIEHAMNGTKANHSKLRLKLEMFYTLGTALRRAQTVFERTGGLFAAGLFDAHGTLVGLREDVMRLNAVDKLIGSMFLNEKMPLDKHILLVSGRACYDVMTKALKAGVPVVCTVGGPSSLAVQFAQTTNLTLIGFLTSEAYNVYSGAERIEV
jgi:FdhD protein